MMHWEGKRLFHLYASEFTGAQEDHVLLICAHTEEHCDETTILQGGQSQHLAAMVNSSSNNWVLLIFSVMNNCRPTIKHLRNMYMGFPCVPW